mgnify:CR=1 FL=1
MSKNVAVFVDVANIFYAAKAAGVDIDYVTLLKSATANRDFVRAYAYTGLDPENENQRQFHAFLARSGYKVVSKDIRKYGDGRVKANLDIELHRLEFIETTEVPTVDGVQEVDVNLWVSGGKVNPLIGAAGVSAVPMAARVVNRVGLEANPHNFLLMHAMGPNVAGVLGSAVAAGLLLALLGGGG